MKTGAALTILSAALLLLALGGCADRTKPGPNGPDAQERRSPVGEEAKIEAALAKLPAEDWELAKAQKYCAVQSDNRLGSMGVPVKVMVKGQPVFLCCKGCRPRALDDPEKTLSQAEKLQAKATGSPAK
jgi:hypothetical protein